MATASRHPRPVIPAHHTVPETTGLSVGLGLVLAVVLSAANVYLGLYVGMTVSASIPAAVVSMAILRGVFRRGTILENNIAQTIASTGESLAAGAIFTLPALVLVGTWQDFRFWPTTIIIMMGGLLGVVFMVPLRKALIVERPDLIYPEGVACAEVLTTGQTGGSGIRYIGAGLLVGGIFKYLVTGLALLKSTVEGAAAVGRSVFYIGSDVSMALLAVGYIVRFQIAMQIFLGGFIGWLICIPVLNDFTPGGDPAAYAWEAWDQRVRFVGVGTMLVGGLHSIWAVRHGVWGGLAGLRGAGRSGGAIRTERNMSMLALLAVFLFAAAGTIGLYEYLIGDWLTAGTAGAMMIVTAFLFVAVATYIVGLVGSSNSPVSGMTICALLLTAGVLMGLGIRGDSAILATLGVAGVVCCAACTSGDVAQDLKTGLLVGATPARQQWAEVLGVVVPAFVFAPVMSLLHRTYVIGEGLRAPQATLFANLTEGFFGDKDLPWDFIILGMVIGVLIVIADAVFVRTKTPARAYVMPIAVGIYLPLALSVPIAIGGAVRAFLERGGRSGSEARDAGVLYGSGLIAGEALTGIGLAGFLTVEALYEPGEAPLWARIVSFPVAHEIAGPVWLSVAALGVGIVVFALIGRRQVD